MSEADQARVRGAVAALREKFIQRTRQDVKDLRRLLSEWSSGTPGAQEDLRQRAHKIHGSGATFGFEQISDIGRQLELLCAATGPTGSLACSPLEPDTQVSLSQLLAELEQSVAHAE